MNPTAITTFQWDTLGRLLLDVAALAFLLTTFALAMLAGHAVVPSLAITGALPARVSRIRPLLYLVAVTALGGAVFFGAEAWGLLPVLGQIFPRFGI